MGSQTKYEKKDLVYVPIKIATTTDGEEAGAVNYAFYTNVPASAKTALGHVAIATPDNPPLNTVLASNFPKPRRASRRDTLRFTSSYCAAGSIRALKLAGWRITTPRVRKPPLHIPELRPTSFVQTVYVTFRGIKYAWQLPKVTITNVTQAVIDGLGIKFATPGDFDELCFGGNAPKPPKASVTISSGSGDDLAAKILSTFYDPSTTTLPTGWTESKAPKIAFN